MIIVIGNSSLISDPHGITMKTVRHSRCHEKPNYVRLYYASLIRLRWNSQFSWYWNELGKLQFQLSFIHVCISRLPFEVFLYFLSVAMKNGWCDGNPTKVADFFLSPVWKMSAVESVNLRPILEADEIEMTRRQFWRLTKLRWRSAIFGALQNSDTHFSVNHRFFGNSPILRWSPPLDKCPSPARDRVLSHSYKYENSPLDSHLTIITPTSYN